MIWCDKNKHSVEIVVGFPIIRHYLLWGSVSPLFRGPGKALEGSTLLRVTTLHLVSAKRRRNHWSWDWSCVLGWANYIAESLCTQWLEPDKQWPTGWLRSVRFRPDVFPSYRWLRVFLLAESIRDNSSLKSVEADTLSHGQKQAVGGWEVWRGEQDNSFWRGVPEANHILRHLNFKN